jgi:hypothetical protein
MLYGIAVAFWSAKHEPKQDTADQVLAKFKLAVQRRQVTTAELKAWVDAHADHDVLPWQAIREIVKAKRVGQATANATRDADTAKARAKTAASDLTQTQSLNDAIEQDRRRVAGLLDGLAADDLEELKVQAITSAPNDFIGNMLARGDVRTHRLLRAEMAKIVERRFGRNGLNGPVVAAPSEERKAATA